MPTLRVRTVADRRHPGQTEPVVVCENPDGCNPLAAECGLLVDGRPAWHRSEWDWLAARLLPLHAA